jgi:hypothetical protein
MLCGNKLKVRKDYYMFPNIVERNNETYRNVVDVNAALLLVSAFGVITITKHYLMKHVSCLFQLVL